LVSVFLFFWLFCRRNCWRDILLFQYFHPFCFNEVACICYVRVDNMRFFPSFFRPVSFWMFVFRIWIRLLVIFFFQLVQSNNSTTTTTDITTGVTVVVVVVVVAPVGELCFRVYLIYLFYFFCWTFYLCVATRENLHTFFHSHVCEAPRVPELNLIHTNA